MSDSRRPSIRLSPRRHDAGAALMRKFRGRHAGATSSGNLRLRMVDALHGLMLTMICFTAAIVLNDDAGDRWRELIHSGQDPATQRPQEIALATSGRTAPAAPTSFTPPAPTVRLTFIEEDGPSTPLMARPATLSTELRVADEEPAHDSARSTSQAARPPLRAALNLGDQPLRTLQR